MSYQAHANWFAGIAAEMWIARSLSAPHVIAGDTTPRIRRERIRAEILCRGLEAAIAGRTKSGRPETWSQLFERLYGEPLVKPGDSGALPLRTSTPTEGEQHVQSQ